MSPAVANQPPISEAELIEIERAFDRIAGVAARLPDKLKSLERRIDSYDEKHGTRRIVNLAHDICEEVERLDCEPIQEGARRLIQLVRRELLSGGPNGH